MLELILTSSVLILVVLLLRFLFRNKISLRLRYALWGLVLLRLLVPVSFFPSPVSMMNAVPVQWSGRTPAATGNPSAAQPGFSPAPGVSTPQSGAPVPQAGQYNREESSAPQTKPLQTADLLRFVWLGGASVFALWFISVNALFTFRLRRKRQAYPMAEYPLPVYIVEEGRAPFLLGIFRPAVYITERIGGDQESLRHVLLHELTHYRHGDHLWSALRVLCLILYWFHPLVWVAGWLSRVDCELACDEAAIRKIGEDKRFAYGRTLVGMISVKAVPGLGLCATTMASSRQGIKARIDRIIHHKKTVLSAALATALVLLAAAGCTFTGATTPPLEQKMEKGLSDPSPLVRQGWEMIRADIEDNEKVSAELFADKGGGTTFTDAEITRLELTDRFDDIREGAVIEAYALEYRMKPEDPAKILLAGGMMLDEEGWLTESSSMGSPWLVAENRGEEITYIGRIYPMGEGGGVLIRVLELLADAGAETGDNLGRLAIEALKNSIFYEDSKIWFRIPEGYPTPSDWNIWISGRAESAAGGISVHLFTEESIERSWIPGEYYMIETAGKGYVELYLSVSLPDGRGGEVVEDIDLLDYVTPQEPVAQTSLEDAVSKAILDNGDRLVGDLLVEAHTILSTVETDDTVVVYAMVLRTGVGYAGAAFAQTNGSHMPVAITFTRTPEGGYLLQEYWIPMDGAGYGPSIREKFPENIWDDAMDTQKYILGHIQSIYRQAVEYGEVDTDYVVEQVLDRILSSLSESSNPGEYMKHMDPVDSRELLYYGDYTLQYIFSTFLAGGQTGLKGHIMREVMDTLIGGEALRLTAETGQEYFDAWRAHAEKLLGKNGPEFMQEQYPKAWMLLSMIEEN